MCTDQAIPEVTFTIMLFTSTYHDQVSLCESGRKTTPRRSALAIVECDWLITHQPPISRWTRSAPSVLRRSDDVDLIEADIAAHIWCGSERV
jgi:hypothetical protein